MNKAPKKRTDQPIERRKVAVFEADPAQGLSSAQVKERTHAGWSNRPVDSPARTTGQIVRSNVLTYFNMVFFVLAACVAFVRSWNNLTFLGVVFVNTAMGIFQELKAKKTLDKLAILSSPRCQAVRNGKVVQLETARLVRDDIVCFSAGDQICADAVIVDGMCSVNEALVTGEADEIRKELGDTLLSGSYLVSGACRARLTAVGADAFAAQLTLEAKKSRKKSRGGMMQALSSLVKWIGIAIIPLGILMFCKEYIWLDRELAVSVTSTVGSLVGMIPEGLYLLTSLALMASVLRLGQQKTLVHDMGCIETLARVDTLCVDKTGTITEPGMEADGLIALCPDRYTQEELAELLAQFAAAMQRDNETMAALQAAYPAAKVRKAREVMPFSSEKKCSGVSFGEDETYLLGAPEMLTKEKTALRLAAEQADTGSRVLLFGVRSGALAAKNAEPLFPLALALLTNRVRPAAPATFSYFREQGVTVKVISGDNPRTAAAAARKAGIPGTENFVDARTLSTPQEIAEAAERCAVFGRVTPERKRELIRAMKAAGHTVAMTGDGVNDVLALKEADCSVAMASGSDVACRVSQVVLLESDFSAMPSVVREGRRVINNIERSAALYLVKNIFSFSLALITLFFTLPYPLMPTQLTLVSALTIGIPSFVLAMEPNERRIQGKFLPNVILRALPAAMADVVMVVTVILFYLAFNLTEGALSTICTCLMGVVGLLMVHRTCQPYTPVRRLLIWSMSIGFVLGVLLLGDLFTLSDLTSSDTLVLVVVALLAKPVTDEFMLLRDQIVGVFKRKKGQGKRLRKGGRYAR